MIGESEGRGQIMADYRKLWSTLFLTRANASRQFPHTIIALRFTRQSPPDDILNLRAFQGMIEKRHTQIDIMVTG